MAVGIQTSLWFDSLKSLPSSFCSGTPSRGSFGSMTFLHIYHCILLTCMCKFSMSSTDLPMQESCTNTKRYSTFSQQLLVHVLNLGACTKMDSCSVQYGNIVCAVKIERMIERVQLCLSTQSPKQQEEQRYLATRISYV